MKKFWLSIYWINWGILFAYWLQGALPLLGGTLSEAFVAFGRLAGLGAAYMILIQFFVIGRPPWLERVYGLDTLTRIHQRNGRRAFVLILLHPLLIILGYSGLVEITFVEQVKSFLTEYKYLPYAAISWILFIIIVGMSLYIVRKRLKYETWYYVHLFTYLAVFLSFWHQIEHGGTLHTQNLFYYYWVGLYLVVFGVHVIFRYIVPTMQFAKHRFTVQKVVRETPNAVSIYIGGRDIQHFTYQAGQFMMWRFLAKGFWHERHPFSISSVPGGDTVRLTVRELGDFTKRVKDLPVGTKVLIEGPFGIFTANKSKEQNVLLIAGGIGITPFRGVMEDLLGQGKDVTLLYANRTEDDRALQGELDTLLKRYPKTARIVHILSNQEGYQGEVGFVDKEKIARLVPDVTKRDVFVCGPPPMLTALIKTLKELGVPEKQMYYEIFSLT